MSGDVGEPNESHVRLAHGAQLARAMKGSYAAGVWATSRRAPSGYSMRGKVSADRVFR